MDIIVEEFRGVSQMPSHFDSLFEHGAARSLFLSRGWFEVLLKNGFDRELGLKIYTASRPDGTPLVVLPLTRGGPHNNLESLANFYSLAFGPLTAEKTLQSELTAAFSHIAAKIQAERHACIHLKPMFYDDPALPSLTVAFRDNGFAVRTYPQSTNYYADTRGKTGFEFERSLSSRLKNTIERRSGDKDAQSFSLHTDGREIDCALHDYAQVYAKSWKEAEPFPDFMPALIRHACSIGALRLGLWHVDGRPAAAQLWLVQEGRATIYKLAHDEQFSPQSVGSALTLAMFRAVLDRDHPSIVDFGLGDESYKQDWTPLKEYRVGWLAFNKTTTRGRWENIKHDLGVIRKRAMVP